MVLAFVEMSNDVETKAATEALNGMQYNGRELVRRSSPTRERPRREFSPVAVAMVSANASNEPLLQW